MKRYLSVVWVMFGVLALAGCARQNAQQLACEAAGGYYAPNGDGGEECFGVSGPEAGYPLGIKAVCEAPQSWPVRKLVLDPKTGAYHDEIAQPVRYAPHRWTKVDDRNYQCVPVTP